MSLDESPARQGIRRLQLLSELEDRGGAIIPLADLERLQAIRRRAIEVLDTPERSQLITEAGATALYILGEEV